MTEKSKVEFEQLKKKLFLFKSNKTVAHVVMKDSKLFYNGKIIKITDDHFVLVDKKSGNVPILFEEVHKIIPYSMK